MILKKFIFSCVSIILCISVINTVFAQSPTSVIQQIQNQYSEVSTKIARIEAEKEYRTSKELVCNEITINKYKRDWPAVGKLNTNILFYYDEPDEGLIPDRIVKIVKNTVISAHSEKKEFLFSKSGDLIFFFLNNNNEESSQSTQLRLYFFNNNLIRIIHGKKINDKPGSEDKNSAEQIIKEAHQLKELFKKTSITY